MSGTVQLLCAGGETETQVVTLHSISSVGSSASHLQLLFQRVDLHCSVRT